MSEFLSETSDEDLARLVFESQVTIPRLEPSPDDVFQRVRKFHRFYQAVPAKPDGAALLYQEKGASAVGACQLGDRFLVGRLSRSERNPGGCDLTVKDAEMSRTHFEIRLADGFYGLRDLESRNGTCVNGTPCTHEVILKGGDVIQAGDTIFVFTGE